MEHHEDHAQHVVDQWAAVRPELDVTPVLVIGRLHRVALALTTELVKVYNAHGLGEGDFDVLATLRRTGEPHELTPTELMDQTMVTSGPVTKRLDRLDGCFFVDRRFAGCDFFIRDAATTEKGRELIDRAAPEHFANEARLLEPL